ncbi:MAG TPA: hypothetical protein VII06_14820 [Chloroflexota bacterium]|jgi:hypothetical protein
MPQLPTKLTIVVVLALVVGLVPVPARVLAQGGAQTPAAQQATDASPRPDLAIGLSDLPPGYETAPSLELMLDDRPLQDRVIRQSEPGAGPGWIWTMTYQGSPPVTQERVNFLAEDLAIFFQRALSDVAIISDWRDRDPGDLGDLAKLYTFSYRIQGSDLVGDGALAIFGPGDYLSYLAVLNYDGQSMSDLRMLAHIVSTRIDAQRTTSQVPR